MRSAFKNAHEVLGTEIIPQEGTWQAEAYANGMKFYGPPEASPQPATPVKVTETVGQHMVAEQAEIELGPVNSAE
jgi:hypothetical protein